MALLIAVIGGVVLGLVAAGRRTATAFPRMLAATDASDALVYSANGFGIPPAAIGQLPGVSRSGLLAFPQEEITFGGRVLPSYWEAVAPASASAGTAVERGRLLQGRWADPQASNEATVQFSPPDGVRLGSQVQLRFYKPNQAGSLFDAFGPIPTPLGPYLTLHVVGVEVSSADFPAGASPTANLYVTAALLHKIAGRSAVAYAYAVRLRDGAAGIASFESAVARLPGGTSLYVDDLTGVYVDIERSIHLQAVSWWILAAIAGLAGLVVVAQLLGRQAAVEAGDYPVLRSIGMQDRDLFLIGFVSTVAIALTGALGAALIAYLLSPLTPIGEAAVAEPSPGLALDAKVLLIGLVSVFVLVAALGAIPVLREARRRNLYDSIEGPRSPSRPSMVAAWLAQAGASLSIVIGTRLAFERGRGRTAVPTFAAFCGATLAVIALTGTQVYGASLGHLLESPRLYGGTFDLQINNPGGTITSIVPALLGYKDISQLSSGVENSVRIGGNLIDTIAETSDKGPLLTPPVISGRTIDGPGQIVLGEKTLSMAHAQVGDKIPVTIGRGTMPFLVVGTAAFPVFGAAGGLGDGAAMSLQSYDRLAGCRPGDHSASCIVDGAVLKLKPGPQAATTLAQLESAYGNGAVVPLVPTSLVNFGQSSDLPLFLGLAVALFGAAALLHFLFVSVNRRRRDTGMLKTLGLRERQLRQMVLWQATAVVFVSIVLGVPLGIAAGRFAWDLTASGYGFISDVVIPDWSLTTIVIGALVAVNLLALAPAVLSSRVRPALLLRAQ
jgi:ABC-type lipoprotein release transport system permease subunit